MSVRSDIIDGRLAMGSSYGLIYTEVLGWIDLGHAQGDDIRNLLEQMRVGESLHNRNEFYEVKYSQGMIGIRRSITISRFIKWRIKKGRSLYERYSIALAMMLTTAGRFESMQASFPFNFVTDSGFSGEDLVSDLLGFYRALSEVGHLERLRPVSKEQALKRWDHYGPIGQYKNRECRPLLFPDPEKEPARQPYIGDLPYFMQTVKPYTQFYSGNVKIASKDAVEVR